MKKKFLAAVATMVAVLMAFGSVAVWAMDYEAPESASTMTARFNVMEDFDAPGVEFSMISEDEELIIHITDDVPVYFEDYVPMGDDEEDGMTLIAREVLFGRTLAEVLDGRNLVVTYGITTRSLPPQTTPISITILFEDFVPLNGEAEATHLVDLPFVDVESHDWFFASVAWVLENSIMNGISETEFAPNAPMTRAMMVTVLWRYAGMPDAAEVPFADVADGAWYAAAIAWAAENGIVLGYDADTFGANDLVTREQAYTILYRYMNFAGLTIALEEEMRLQQFADEDAISSWAIDALHFMFDAGVMFRYSSLDMYARPQQNALRGEIAAAVYFFDMFAVADLDEENGVIDVDDVIDVVDGIFYEFDNAGFSLEFPASWEGRYGLYEHYFEVEGETRRFVNIYHIPTREILGNEYVGTLFWFGRVPGEHYTEEEPPMMAGKAIILAQVDGYTYFMGFPSDVQWNYEDPECETSVEFLEMQDQWELIADSFMLI
ncbi:MAG: S-layer homology domain-containing protein [Defluviitaleaceae bacterium]|nr:S-layer homology domain-containing protein [Defluviitaleaceae bacterium]